MWQSPPAVLSLGYDEVHVWHAQLDVSTHDLVAYERSLSADERSRVQLLHHSVDQRRFIARRGILRRLLSIYLDIKPAKILFKYTDYGQPRLSVRDQSNALRFTLAYASDHALYAVSQSRDIGIDIEYLQCSFDYELIASSLFAAEEFALLSALPLAQRTRAFFRLWACKEAYIKACGLGLSLPLNTFAVALDLDQPALLLYGHNQADALHSSLRELPINEHHVAALAVNGNDWHLRCWHYI